MAGAESPAEIGSENKSEKSTNICCYCGRTVITVVSCPKCEGIFHNSCLGRHTKCPADEKENSRESEVMSGEENHLIRENMLLRRIIEEQDGKNKVLQEHILLLEQTIRLPEVNNNHTLQKIDGMYQELIQAKDAIIAATSATLKAKDQLVNELLAKINTQCNKNIEPSKITYANKADIGKSSGTKDLQEETKTASNTIMKVQHGGTINPSVKTKASDRQITREQVKLAIEEVKSTTTTNGLTNPAPDDWKQARSRRYRPKTLGTAKITNSEFSGTEKKLWLYLYRINIEATAGKIEAYIKRKDPSLEKDIIVKEIPGDSEKLKRFMVSAPFTKKDEFYDPGFWPSGVGIKRFDFRKHRGLLQQQPADFF